MKNKNILIIALFIVAVVVLGIGGIFLLKDNNVNQKKDINNTLKEEDYVADDYVFNGADDVVTFLKNIYDSDKVEITSCDDKICKIKAETNDGTIYDYTYDLVDKLLLSDDEVSNDDNVS